jgi:hypothetical protein
VGAYRETAEEQLLRMIEGSQPVGEDKPVRLEQSRMGVRILSGRRLFQGWKWRFPFKQWERPRRPRASGAMEGDPIVEKLRLAGKILWVALAVLGAYVVVDLAVLRRTPKEYEIPQKDALGSRESSVQVASPLKPLGEYLTGILKRDPFMGMASQTPKAAPVTIKRRLDEMVQGLVVVGIDRGPNPAALIEDQQTGRTTVIRVGDTVRDAKVKKIDGDGVLLTYEGEEHLLR